MVGQVPPEFGLEVDETHSPYTVLVARGDLDVYTCPRLRESLLHLMDEGHRKIVIDLDGVDFIDSAGLGVIVSGMKRLRGYGGELSLVCSRPNLLKLFQITGLTSIFQIAAEVDDLAAG